MSTKVKRRLTTVLCADVEGYSRLMELDETGTLARLQRYRAAMGTLIARHDGRIVNTWGDAVIAEFSSVVEAVQCAVETQQEISSHNDSLPEAERMRFRVGINLGDVMVEGEDVYGEGVNVAARLQQLADPGGILISGPVYDQVYNKLSIGFDPLGPQHVKNVTTPIMSYRIVQGDGSARPGEARPLPRIGSGGQNFLDQIWNWYTRLPRSVAAILAVCAFLFLLNVFTGLHEIWFQWPVAPLLLIAVLMAIARKRS